MNATLATRSSWGKLDFEGDVMKMRSTFLLSFFVVLILTPSMSAAAPCFSLRGRVAAGATFVWTGEHYLVLWVERSEGGSNLLARRVAANGELIDEVPRVVDMYSSTRYQVSAAYTDGVVLVALEEPVDAFNSNVGIRRLNTEGVAIGEELLIRNATAARVGAAPGQFMVAYSPYTIRQWTSTDFWRDDEVAAVRINAGGAVIDTQPIVIATGRLIQRAADVHFIDDTWVIAWTAGEPVFCGGMPCAGPGPALRVTRIRSNRVVLDYGGLAVAPEAFSASADCNGEVCLIAWNTLSGVRASWFDPHGGLSPSFLVSTMDLTLGSSTAWSGEHFVVAWHYGFPLATVNAALIAPQATVPELTLTIAPTNFHDYTLFPGPFGSVVATSYDGEFAVLTSCARPRGVVRR
jgi:hypothetical protein